MSNFETGRATTADPNRVGTRDDLTAFLEVVLQDFRQTGKSEWENKTLECFLDGLAAFAGARVVDVKGEDEASWALFAQMIQAATGYE